MNSSAASEAGLLGLYDHFLIDLRDPRVDSWPLMASPWPTFGLCALYYFIVRYEAGAIGWRNQKKEKTEKFKETFSGLLASASWKTRQLTSAGQQCSSTTCFKLSSVCGSSADSEGSGWRGNITGSVNRSITQTLRMDSSNQWQYQEHSIAYFFPVLQTLCGGIFSPSLQTLWILSSWFLKRRITSWPLCMWFTTWSCPCAAGSSSSGLAAATQPSLCSSTWASTWWCTFTTSCLAWALRCRSISGGKDTLPVVNDQRIESVFKHVIVLILEMQLLQFVSFSIHALIPLFTSCSYPTPAAFFIIFLGVLFFTLFINFYIKSYTKKASLKNVKSEWFYIIYFKNIK